jgi:hypothetical protein
MNYDEKRLLAGAVIFLLANETVNKLAMTLGEVKEEKRVEVMRKRNQAWEYQQLGARMAGVQIESGAPYDESCFPIIEKLLEKFGVLDAVMDA